MQASMRVSSHKRGARGIRELRAHDVRRGAGPASPRPVSSSTASRADPSDMRFRPLKPRSKKNELLPGNPCHPVGGRARGGHLTPDIATCGAGAGPAMGGIRERNLSTITDGPPPLHILRAGHCRLCSPCAPRDITKGGWRFSIRLASPSRADEALSRSAPILGGSCV
jgi:hypothetical protein